MEDRVAFADSRESNWHEFLRGLRKRNPLGLSQCVLYFLAVFWGLLVEIPMGITMRDFDHRCILFAEVVWKNSVIWPWYEPTCDLVLYTTLGVTFFYALSMAIFTLLSVLPRQSLRYDSFSYLQTANVMYILRALNPIFLVVNIVVTLSLLSVAVVLTYGFYFFCVSTMKHFREDGYTIKTCIDVQNVDWSRYPIEGGRDDGPRGFRFNTCLSIAVIGAWGGFVTWLLQMILNCSLLCAGCTCMVAEEKQQTNKSLMIAARRSRMATPIGTPGHMTPRPYPPGWMYGQYPQGPASQYGRGPPSHGAPSVYSQGPPSQYSHPSQYSKGLAPYQYGPPAHPRGPPSQSSQGFPGQGPPAQYRGPPSQSSQGYPGQGPPAQYRGPPSQSSQGYPGQGPPAQYRHPPGQYPGQHHPPYGQSNA